MHPSMALRQGVNQRPASARARPARPARPAHPRQQRQQQQQQQQPQQQQQQRPQRPQQRARSSRPPFTLSAAHGGFDRMHPPAPSNPQNDGSGRRRIGAVEWLKELFIHSNMDFCGLYLVGDIPNGSNRHDFTHSSTAADRRTWMGNNRRPGSQEVLREIMPHGWGFVLFYVGYSVGGFEPAPQSLYNDQESQRVGKLHGQHIKKLVYERGPEFAGSTVMVDNEDSSDVNLGPFLYQYYRSMFEEMQSPGPGPWNAVRPGLYAHPPQATNLARAFPDLFVWVVQVGGHWDLPSGQPEPFEQRDVTPASATNPVPRLTRVPHRGSPPNANDDWEPDWHKVPAVPDAPQPPPTENITIPTRFIQLNGIPVDNRAAIPIGGQVAYYKRQPMPTNELGTILTPRCSLRKLFPVSDWDYDISLVRDPCFPFAYPRFCISSAGKYCGFYSKTDLSMRVYEKAGNRTVEIVSTEDDSVMPEAPLVSISDREFLTIGSSGRILLATATQDPPRWSQFSALPDPSPTATTPALRRLRAVQVAVRAPDDVQVLYVSESRQIFGRRRFRNVWSDPQPFADGTRLHSFSNIACTCRGDESVDIFFVDESGSLHTAWWQWDPRKPTTWPSATHQNLPVSNQPNPLPATALQAVSPSSTEILVFYIASDLRLYMRIFSVASGWSSQGAIAVDNGRNEFLFPHCRMAALNTSATSIRIAVLTDQGDPCVYQVDKASAATSQWIPANSRVLLRKRAAALPTASPRANLSLASAPDAEAITFDVNPFGDIELRMFDRALTVFVAGVRRGESALLWKKVDTAEPWWRERLQR